MSIGDLLERFELHRDSLGCVMLDLSPTFVPPIEVIPSWWGYTSPNPDRGWITGVQPTDKLHLTLKYGLLPGLVDAAAVDAALEGWAPDTVSTDSLAVFESPYPDEAYSCIVARQTHPTGAVRDANRRLSGLPHVDLYSEYRPHVTLAFVCPEYTEPAMEILRRTLRARDVYAPATFEPRGLNYGSLLGGKR